MIKTFSCKHTYLLFKREETPYFPESIKRRAYRKLVMINRSANLHELKSPPSNHFKKLKGKRKLQYSIRINIQWRVTFIWKEKNAYDVKIEDYHS